jgi:putative peptidoglycan lipid II flippase
MAALMTLWLSLLVVLGIIAMPQLMSVLAPGFAGDPAKFQMAIELTRITFPYLLLICLTALVSGVLNGLDRFAAAAAAPIFFNLLSMAALLVLTPYVATPAHALAWGVTVSGAVQLGLVLWACARAGMPLRFLKPPSLAPEVRQVLRRMGPGIIGAGVTQLNLAVDVIIASFLPAGAVSYLYYADRVGQLPLGVIGAAVGTAMLPLLSRQVRSGETLSAHRTMNRAMELSLLLCLPAAAGQAAAAWPIVSVLFQRGAFGAEEAALTAAALSAYALGLPAYVLVKIYAPGFFARGDTATPVKVGFAAVALNVALNLLLIPEFGMMGAAVATIGAYGTLFLGMAWKAQRVFPVPYQWRRVVTAFGTAVALTVVGRAFDLPLAAAIAIVAVYPLVLLPLGFYLPEELRRMRVITMPSR